MKKTFKSVFNNTIRITNNCLGKVNQRYWSWFYKKCWPFVEKFCGSVTRFGEMYDELPKVFVQKVLLIFDAVLLLPIIFIGTIATRSVFAAILMCILIACTVIVAVKVKKEYLEIKNNK